MMRLGHLIYLFFNTFTFIVPQATIKMERPPDCSWAPAVSEQEISEVFFKPFSRYPRPRLDAMEPVIVDMHLFFENLFDIIERAMIIWVSAYLNLGWTDEFRNWKDTFPYNCTDYVVLPANDTWLPDVALIGTENHYHFINRTGEYVRNHKDGRVYYSPGGTFSVECDFNLKMFPFDVQSCPIIFESPKYTLDHQRYRLKSNISIAEWKNDQWSLIDLSQSLQEVTSSSSMDSFHHVRFTITVKRKVAYYVTTVIIPSLMIVLAHFSTFMLPSRDLDKLQISTTSFMAYAIFQVIIAADLPRSSEAVPLLIIYINLQMALITLAMLGEGLTYYCFGKADAQDPTPKCLMKLVLCLGPILFIRRRHIHVLPQLNSKPQQTSENPERQRSLSIFNLDFVAISNKNDWTYLATFIERTTIVLYLFTAIISPVVMFVIYPKTQS